MPLSDTAFRILSEASQHPLGLATPPATLPAAARSAVLRSLLKQGLLVESTAPVGENGRGWPQHDGALVAMQITGEGRQAIGTDVPRNAVDEAGLDGLSEAKYQTEHAVQRALDAGIALTADDVAAQAVASDIIPASAFDEPPGELSEAPRAAAVGAGGNPTEAAGSRSTSLLGTTGQLGLRAAAHSLIAAWDAPDRPDLAAAINALRAVLATHHAASSPTGPRQPRQDTKQAAVLALLRRPEGASGPQMIEVTGWAPHTVRGFLAGLARKGIAVTVLERVRQVGPNKAGAKGSYSIYRVMDAG